MIENNENTKVEKKDEFDRSLIFKFLLWNTPWIVLGVVAIVFVIFSFLTVLVPFVFLSFVFVKLAKIKFNFGKKKEVSEEKPKKKKNFLALHLSKAREGLEKINTFNSAN